MPPRRSPLLALALALAACDTPADPPPVVVVPDDAGPEADGAPPPDLAVDMAPPPDMARPPPDTGPMCVDPCDDGDPRTTGDTCRPDADACFGDPLPPMLVRLGDARLAAGEGRPVPGTPSAPLLRVVPDGGALRLEPGPGVALRGRVTATPDGVWLARPLADVWRTAVLRLGADGYTEVARGPLVPGAKAWPADGGAIVLVGEAAPAGAPVVHLAADGAETAIGAGAADAAGFLGVVDGALVARTLGAAPGAPWVVDPNPPGSLERARVVDGVGLLPTDGALRVVDIAGARHAEVALSGAVRLGRGWLAPRVGGALVDLSVWPPALHPTPVDWLDIHLLDGGAIAFGGDGTLWWIPLGEAPGAPVEMGTVPSFAAIVGAHPDGRGVVLQTLDTAWFVPAGGEVGPPTPVSGALVGFGGATAYFAGPRRVEALDTATGAVAALDGAFGPVLAVDADGALLVLDAEPAPMRLARLDADGLTPLSTVWTPTARQLDDPVDWVRTGGGTAAFVAETDGPLVALDLRDPDAEPIAAARLRFGTRWAIGGVSGDGRWVLWRAGDEIIGGLRAARVDGSDYPDGHELVRSRAYPPVIPPEGPLVAIRYTPRPDIGFPIADLDREPLDQPMWVVSEGNGLFPIAWVDARTLLVGLCDGDLECEAYGLGRVDVLDDIAVFAPLVGTDARMPYPEWGQTVSVADGVVYYVRGGAALEPAEIRRIALDGRGPWAVVARGAPPARVLGPAEGGVVFEIDGALRYTALVGAPSDLELPGPPLSVLPGGPERPPLALADPADGPPCSGCRAWRLDAAGGPPTPLGDGALRPVAFAPGGDVVVHRRVIDGRLGLALTDDHEGPLADLPLPADADVEFVGWITE